MIMSYRYPAGSGRSWLGDHHPPWPPLCKGGKMIMSYRYPAGSGRSWLGGHHPWPWRRLAIPAGCLARISRPESKRDLDSADAD